MSLIRIDHNPSGRQLKLFGLAWLIFVGVLAGVLFYKQAPAALAWTLTAMAGAVPVVGWIAPPVMRVVYLGMAYLAFPIGFVVSHLVMAASYYLVMTPTGLLMRLFRYDPLRRRFEREADTYWIPRQTKSDPRDYFRQF